MDTAIASARRRRRPEGLARPARRGTGAPRRSRGDRKVSGVGGTPPRPRKERCAARWLCRRQIRAAAGSVSAKDPSQNKCVNCGDVIPCRHPRESGDPAWVPAFAGMTARGNSHRRRANPSAVMAGPVVQFGDMADTCSETWLTPQVVVKSIAPIRCAPKKMP
jgi:hypothetical protein